MSFIKIVIADDHQLFRDGIASLLAHDENFKVINQASNGVELLELLKENQPHVVLIDIAMPEMDGLKVIDRAKNKYPDVKFIVLTMHEEGQYVSQAIRNGAYGFLLKNTDEHELKQAIESVVQGKKYFNQHISSLMIDNMALEGDMTKQLSRRETEILQLVSEGKTTKEIASELCVSTRTIETHRVNIMKKLNVQNSAEMIKKAAHLKII